MTIILLYLANRISGVVIDLDIIGLVSVSTGGSTETADDFLHPAKHINKRGLYNHLSTTDDSRAALAFTANALNVEQNSGDFNVSIPIS